MDQFLAPETDTKRQFLEPETDVKCQFLLLGPETDILCQFLEPETDIMGERNYISESQVLLSPIILALIQSNGRTFTS